MIRLGAAVRRYVSRAVGSSAPLDEAALSPRLTARASGPRRLNTSDGPRPASHLWVVLLVLVLLTALVVVPGVAYYRIYIQPPQVWVGRIGGETVLTIGDVADRMQAVARLNLADTGTPAVGGNPLDVLRTMLEDELIRRAASRFGTQISEVDVDDALHRRFVAGYATADLSDERIEQEFQEEYGRFLTRGRISDDEYRDLVRVQILREGMKHELGNRIARVTEQVEVAWIVLPADFEEVGSVFALLEAGEPFESVAASLNTDLFFTSPTRPGYVGWVPRGAFPQLDKYLFDESVAQGELLAPVYLRTGVYLIGIISSPAAREIDNEKMLEQLRAQALRAWMEEEWDRQNVETSFDSEHYRWVVDYVRDTLPVTNE